MNFRTMKSLENQWVYSILYNEGVISSISDQYTFILNTFLFLSMRLLVILLIIIFIFYNESHSEPVIKSALIVFF